MAESRGVKDPFISRQPPVGGQRRPGADPSPPRWSSYGSGDYVDSLAADAAMPEQSLIERDEVTTLKELLGVLDTRTRYAVEQRLGLTDGRRRSYRQVAQEVGSTPEAARRVVERAPSPLYALRLRHARPQRGEPVIAHGGVRGQEDVIERAR